MKIDFTVELDKELAEFIQSPIKNFLEGLLALASSSFAPPVKEPEPTVKEENVTKGTPVKEKAPQGPETVVKSEPSDAPEPKAKPGEVKKTILEAIQSRKTGIDAKGIVKLTGLTGKQISNNLFHLKKAGLVRKKKGGKFVAIKIKEPTIEE